MGDVVDTLLGIMKARDKIRPISHWDNHCVNCGIQKGDLHIRNDCPPQNWEAPTPNSEAREEAE